MRRTRLVLGLLVLVATFSARADGQPNLLFVLADDLGWADTTLYGHTKFYQTPNLERLAKRGMTFTRAYSASPLCSPTRASILTGLSPARLGLTSPNCHLPQVVLEATPGKKAAPNQKVLQPDPVTRLKTEYFTLAKALKEAGYATGHFGKWHLGPEPYSPRQHGFDVDVPHWPGPGPSGSYVAPWKFKDFDADPGEPHQHLEDRMAKEAVAFLQKHKDRPFFLNYWMFSVHAPFDAKKALIEKHRARVDPADPQRSPTYAAMVESMDDAVGTLLDTLDRLGLADRTIIVFFSDNGGNMYDQVDGTTPTSNAPLRGGKATVFEGGIRVPCVIAWPGRTAPGSRSDALVQSTDFYPTLLEMLGLKPRPGQTFDGRSFVPALQGRPFEREPIFTYFPHAPGVPDWLPPSVATHQGDWKLIRIFHGGAGAAHRWKLFNLRDDPGEKNDLAAKNPERVQQMDALIEKFLADTKAVVPVPNPDFDPAKYHPEEEGRQKNRKAGNAKASPGAGPSGQAVGGWTAVKDCSLTWQEGALVITATGNDPHLAAQLPKPLPAGPWVVTMNLSSTAQGKGQFFWQEQGVQPPFFRERSVVFDLAHTSQAQEVRLEFTAAKPVTAVRLDPAQAAGVIRLTSLRVAAKDGKPAQEWDFAKRP